MIDLEFRDIGLWGLEDLVMIYEVTMLHLRSYGYCKYFMIYEL